MDINSISPVSNIETLVVNRLVLNGDNSILYIMKKYSNLKQLEINGSNENVFWNRPDYVAI